MSTYVRVDSDWPPPVPKSAKTPADMCFHAQIRVFSFLTDNPFRAQTGVICCPVICDPLANG